MKKILSMVLTVAMLLSCMTLLVLPTSADTYSEDAYDSTTNFTITTKADLLAFLASKKDFNGKTVTLADNITLNATTGDWVASATKVTIGDRYFKGVFDGNNKTIYGLYIEDTIGWYQGTGMFAGARCALIKNLTLDGFYISSGANVDSPNLYEGFAVGAFIGRADRGSAVEGCTLKNGVIAAKDDVVCPKIGTIYGFGKFNNAAADSGSTNGVTGDVMKITNTKVEDTVKIVYNGTTNGVPRNFGFGAVGGYTAVSIDMTFDFTGSSFKVADGNGDVVTKVSGNVFGQKAKIVTLKNGDWEYVIEARGDSGEGHFDEPFNHYAGSADCGILPVLPTMPTDNTFSTLNYETDTEFLISTAEDYMAFDAAVHGGGRDFEGKTVKLANDIVMNDTTVANWTETAANKLRTNNPASASYFKGTFDGCGNTIYGLYIGGHAGWWYGTGMFAGTGYSADKQSGSATIRNLTLNGFYMSSGAWADGVNLYEAYSVGAFIGRSQGGDAIINCKLKNGVLTTDNSVGAPKVGSLIGVCKGGSLGTLIVNDVIVEESVKVVYTGTLFDAATLTDPRMSGVGGIIGVYMCGGNTNDFVLDFTGSVMKPVDKNGTAMTNPIAVVHSDSASVKFKVENRAKNYTGTKTISLDGLTVLNVARDVNDLITATACAVYGANAVVTEKFTVTWSVNGQETTSKYSAGIAPEFSGNLTKADTDTHVYRFKGWTTDGGTTVLTTLPAVSADVTYTAVFDELEKVTVTWITAKGTTTEVYAKGDVPAFKGDTSKDSTETSIFDFDDWDKELAALTGDTTFTAQYNETKLYIVTWKVDGQADVTEKYMEGQTPAWKNKKPAKAEDDDYTYTFTGWDKKLGPISEDTVYTAVFEKTAKNPDAAGTTDGEGTDATGNTTEKKGCGSSVLLGGGLITVLGMAAFGIVIRKKED